MKKIVLILLLAVASLSASPQAVVFDYGDVLAFHNREVVVQFFCKTFQLTQDEFQKVKQAKKTSGQSDENFWITFAYEKGIALPTNWQEIYKARLYTI